MLIIMPAFSSAKGLVPCGGAGEPSCDFNAFIILIDKIINFMIIDLALPIAGIMFAYAGFLMVTAGDEAAGARTRAKGIFMNALIGLILAAACWIIVNTILSVLGFNGSWLGFKQI